VDWLLEPFTCATCGFVRTALAAGLVTVVTTSVVGTWIVLRGMTFMGDALAHGVLPGLTLAVVFGFDLGLGAAVAALVMIGGLHLVHRRSRLAPDAGIGLLFVGMLALGVVIASLAPSFAGDLTTILFGDIIAVTTADLRAASAAAVGVVVASALLYRPFLVLAFSERKAAALGLRPGLAHAAMLVLLAVAIIASFRAVGTLLVFAFLVAPPATASLVARRVPTMMLAATGFGAVGVVAGLLISFHLATAGSATMAVVTVAEFFAVLAVQELRQRRAAARARAASAPA
jgi:ABC-type Mn2+/Zn2+ transport system permease subunit